MDEANRVPDRHLLGPAMSTETRLNGNWISLVPGGGEGTGFRHSHRRPGYTDGARSGYPHRSDHSPMDVNLSCILLRSLSLRQFITIGSFAGWRSIEHRAGPIRIRVSCVQNAVLYALYACGRHALRYPRCIVAEVGEVGKGPQSASRVWGEGS